MAPLVYNPPQREAIQMGRKIDPRVLRELQKPPGRPFGAPLPPPPPSAPPPPPAQPQTVVVHARGGGTSALSVCLGILLAVLVLTVLPFLLMGGCVAGCMTLGAGTAAHTANATR